MLMYRIKLWFPITDTIFESKVEVTYTYNQPMTLKGKDRSLSFSERRFLHVAQVLPIVCRLQ